MRKADRRKLLRLLQARMYLLRRDIYAGEPKLINLGITQCVRIIEELVAHYSTTKK